MQIHSREPGKEVWKRFLLWRAPSVIKDKNIISADSKNNENGQHMKNTNIAEIEDNPVNHVGAKEGCKYAEQCPTGDPQRMSLKKHKNENERKATKNKQEIRYDLFRSGFKKQRPQIIIKVQVSNSWFVKLSKLLWESSTGVFLRKIKLLIWGVWNTSETFKWEPERKERSCVWRLGNWRSNNSVLAEMKV